MADPLTTSTSKRFRFLVTSQSSLPWKQYILILRSFNFIVVTSILIYSRSNALITCHQVSEELPLSWLDTPFQLPLPRNNPSLPPATANLGLIILSDFNTENTTPTSNFTTFRLLPDLTIVGDMYGSRETEITSFVRGESLNKLNLESPTGEEDSESEHWIPFQSNWNFDVTGIAERVIPVIPTTNENISRQQIRKMNEKVVENVIDKGSQFRTMYVCHDGIELIQVC